jgi:hypothetical protein
LMADLGDACRYRPASLWATGRWSTGRRQPVVAAILGVAVLLERLTRTAIVGLVLVGLALAALAAGRALVRQAGTASCISLPGLVSVHPKMGWSPACVA